MWKLTGKNVKEGGGGGFLAFYTSTGAFYTSTGEMTTCHFIFRQCFNHHFRLNKYSARDRLFGKISLSNFKLEFHFYWREAHVKATEILVEKIQRELLTFNPLIDEHPPPPPQTHTHTLYNIKIFSPIWTTEIYVERRIHKKDLFCLTRNIKGRELWYIVSNGYSNE